METFFRVLTQLGESLPSLKLDSLFVEGLH